jgi:glycosyltransferase involved in cell wall biosynthesis
MGSAHVLGQGVDRVSFAPKKSGKRVLRDTYRLPEGFTLLHLADGACGSDLEFVGKLYSSLLHRKKELNLVVTGEGPHLETFAVRMRPYPRVIFPGKQQDSEIVPYLYSGADLLLLPGATSGSSQKVAEVQACGVPALVSDKSRVCPMIVDRETGFIVASGDRRAWEERILYCLRLFESGAAQYEYMRHAVRTHMEQHYSCAALLSRMLEDRAAAPAPAGCQAPQADARPEIMAGA